MTNLVPKTPFLYKRKLIWNWNLSGDEVEPVIVCFLKTKQQYFSKAYKKAIYWSWSSDLMACQRQPPEVFHKFHRKHLNTCIWVSFFIKLQPATLFEKTLRSKYFSVNFAKFWRTPFFIEHLQWLLLACANSTSNIRVYSRPLLGATISPNLVPLVLQKIFSLEVVLKKIIFVRSG